MTRLQLLILVILAALVLLLFSHPVQDWLYASADGDPTHPDDLWRLSTP